MDASHYGVLLERVTVHSTGELGVQARVKLDFTLRLMPTQTLNRWHLMRVELVRIVCGLALVLQIAATLPITIEQGIAAITTIQGYPANLKEIKWGNKFLWLVLVYIYIILG